MFRIVLAYLGFGTGEEQWPVRESNMRPAVQAGIPIATVVMFAVVLLVQQAWVDELARPQWVNTLTGLAVIGWLVGTIFVAFGSVWARWIPSLASVAGLGAQWGDTLGGEVGFDLGFYRTQGIAIAAHLVITVGLAMVPLLGGQATPQDAIRT